jgi:hypothetical protein
LESQVWSGCRNTSNQHYQMIVSLPPWRSIQKGSFEYPLLYKAPNGSPQTFCRPSAFDSGVQHMNDIAPGSARPESANRRQPLIKAREHTIHMHLISRFAGDPNGLWISRTQSWIAA